MSNQNRVPPGSPEGGQYARSARSESTLSLTGSRWRLPGVLNDEELTYRAQASDPRVLSVETHAEHLIVRRRIDHATSPLHVQQLAAECRGYTDPQDRDVVVMRTKRRMNENLSKTLDVNQAMFDSADSGLTAREVDLTHRDFGWNAPRLTSTSESVTVDGSSARVRSVVEAMAENRPRQQSPVNASPDAASHPGVQYPTRGRLTRARQRRNIEKVLAARGFKDADVHPNVPLAQDEVWASRVGYYRRGQTWVAIDHSGVAYDAYSHPMQEADRINQAISRAWMRRGVSRSDAARRLQYGDEQDRSVPVSHLIPEHASHMVLTSGGPDGEQQMIHRNGHLVVDSATGDMILRAREQPYN